MKTKNPVHAPSTLRALATVLPFVVCASLPGAVSASAAATGTASSQAQAAEVDGRGSISGRVLNVATGEYLRFAEIKLEGTNISTTAEMGGEFFIANIPSGTYQLRVSYGDLQPLTQTVVVQAGQTSTLALNLGAKSAEGQDVIQLEAMVVRSEKEGQRKAEQMQKESLNNISVVAADAYGSVADGNAAEMLKNMPGLSLDYREGDSTFIRVRGFGPEYTAIQMDGNPVANTASGNATNTSTNPGNAGGRGFEFEAFSLANIEFVEVTKVPMADSPASGGAGVVNMRTRRAFDRKGEHFNINYGLSATSLLPITLSGDVGLPKNRQGHNAFPSFGIGYSNTFFGDSLGVSATIFQSTMVGGMRRNNMNWYFDKDATNNATELVGWRGFELKDGIASTLRKSFGLNLDYKLSRAAWIGVRYSYSSFDRDIYDRLAGIATAGSNTTLYDSTTGFSVSPLYDTSFTRTQTDFQFKGTAGTTVGSTGTSNYTEAKLRGSFFNKFSDTHQLSLPYGYKLGAFSLEGSVSWSVAQTWYNGFDKGFSPPDLVMRGAALNVKLADIYTKPFVQVTQLSGPYGTALDSSTSFFNVLNYPYRSATPLAAGATYNDAGSYTISNAGRCGRNDYWSWSNNAKYSFAGWRFPTEVRTGVQYTNSFIQERRWQQSYLYMPANREFTNFVEDKFPYLGSAYSNFAPLWLDREAQRVWTLQHLSDTNYFTQPEYAMAGDRSVELKNSKDMSEITYSSYLMSITKIGRLDVIPGVRFERYEFWGKAYKDIGDRAARALLGLPALASGTSTSATNTPPYGQNTQAYQYIRYGQKASYTSLKNDWFNNFQLRYRLTESVKLTAAYRESIKRPSLGYLLPGVSSTNPDATPYPTVTTGNPDLKPEYGKTVDLGVSMDNKYGFFSVSVYRQNFKSMIKNNVSDTVLGDDGVFGEKEYAGYMWIHPINVDAPVHMTGLEISCRERLSMLPGLLKGFEVGGNFNLNRPDNAANFLFTPRRKAAFLINYRWRNITLQNNINWTGAYPYYANSTTTPAQQYRDSQTTVDSTLKVQLTKRLSMSLAAKNLTGAADRYYTDKVRHLVNSYLEYGTSYNLSVSYAY